MTNPHKKFGDSNTFIALSSPVLPGNLLQFLAFLTVTLGWRGLRRLPDFSGAAPDLARLANEFRSG
jgi:hypothetical protein